MPAGKTFGALIGAAMVVGLAVGAVAQQSQSQDHSMPGMSGAAQGGNSMKDAMSRMYRDMMAAPQTGNADQDFVAMMIPHHQGAIDMAKEELATGKDPEMRKLAEDIVKAQESEIAQMRAWQKAHPAKP
jgi:uncharacterized protein (DUF305 family)